MKGLLVLTMFGLLFITILTVSIFLLCKSGLLDKAEKFMEEYEKSRFRSQLSNMASSANEVREGRHSLIVVGGKHLHTYVQMLGSIPTLAFYFLSCYKRKGGVPMSVEQFLYVANRYADVIEERMAACLILIVSMAVVIVACFIGVATIAVRNWLYTRGY